MTKPADSKKTGHGCQQQPPSASGISRTQTLDGGAHVLTFGLERQAVQFAFQNQGLFAQGQLA